MTDGEENLRGVMGPQTFSLLCFCVAALFGSLNILATFSPFKKQVQSLEVKCLFCWELITAECSELCSFQLSTPSRQLLLLTPTFGSGINKPIFVLFSLSCYTC